ncbi:hypothetical protein CTAYLR_003605 [Chrysophaeum taylorii]|uniref:Poly [ADP-ribose] polymerase n=1 Tax=Chrysophaeum taylorii TaxID=2483200 RepID=A0AAD7XL19_9STRA|nr:hypothetical protein CTAYLR_003605 [Chrysophaeum taylorii]
MLCAAILGMFLIVFVVSRHRMKANFRRTLRMIQSTNVDIFEAIQPFEPGDLGRHFSFDDKMMSDEGEERKEPDCPELGELPPRDKPECGATLRLLNFPSALPCELQGQGALPVRVGMFIRVVRTYSDPHGDWCYGIKILDSPLSSGDENHAFHTNSAGWFPTRCVKKAGHNLLRKSRSGTNEVMQLLRPPNSWSDVTDRRKAELMLLEDADLERIEVVSHFNIRTIEVLSVERVQNLSMWQCFMMKQAVVLTRENVSQDVNNNVADGKFVVYPVFHGTTGSVARKIVQQGFNRSFCGKHAVRLGKGVYFARDSGYSCMPKYSTPDEEGTQHVFVCRIVVGHACVGRNGALAPDIRNPDTLELYDTTVDSTSNPRIFVTYNDHQCYPCYLVKFRQRAALAMQVEPEQASHT